MPVFVASAPSGNGRNGPPSYWHAFLAENLIPEPEPVIPPQETPAQRARRFQAMVDSGEARSRADLARLLGCSRAWVTKVLATGAEEPDTPEFWGGWSFPAGQEVVRRKILGGLISDYHQKAA